LLDEGANAKLSAEARQAVLAEQTLVKAPNLKGRLDLTGGGRYKHPQAWIDQVVESDPALSGVRLSYPPRYSGRLKAFGQATLEEPGVRGSPTSGVLPL